MQKRMIVGALGFTYVLVLAGCGGADPTPTGSNESKSTGTKSGTETGSDPTTPAPSASTTGTPPTACAPVGSKGNAKGVGQYCDGKTAKCSGDTFCTADVGAPEGAWFCSQFCAKDAECGEGASCYHEARGSACVPNACLSK
jgi:hypothetical protein